MVLGVKDYAPVFIPTLCRDVHFKRSVDSLSKCTGAEFTTLIIGLDYPLKESHWDGYQKIKSYIPTITGFKKIEVLERSENYGALKNVVEAQKYIFERYETCIYSEDDNEFSPNFLEFVNKGLLLYKDEPQVIAICGYVYPHDYTAKGDVLWGLGMSAWGVGEWRNKRLSIQQDDVTKFLDCILNSWSNTLKVFMIVPKSVNSMITMRTRGVIWGDVLITVNCALKNKGAIFPTLSKVRNWGDDGSGLHCKKDEGTSTQVIDERTHFEDEFDVDFSYRENFTFRHKLPITIKTAILFRYVIYRFTHKDILARHYQNRRD